MSKRVHLLWEELREQGILFNGGTGFFGCWLLESWVYDNDRLKLAASAVVLTKDPDAFRQKSSYLAQNLVILLYSGDVRNFEFPSGNFSHIFHSATDTRSSMDQDDPLILLNTMVEETRHTLEFARQCGARKFLLTSSWAVYRKPDPEITHIPETHPGAPDLATLHLMYGEGKPVAELLCTFYVRRYNIGTKIACCFAFIGPHIPLKAHFAVGNFISDAMNGGPIHVQGDGTPYRSYLYAADLMVWLWTILIAGLSYRPYNVGSENAISIKNLAELVAHSLTKATPIQVEIARSPVNNGSHNYYVPSTNRAQNELLLTEQIPLEDAIRRTVAWHMNNQ